MIASVRMYEWTPSLAAAWRRLLASVTARAGVPLTIDVSPSDSLDALWSGEDMGCVMMCGYPYARRASRPAILAAPVPSPARYNDRPVYVTDFVVRADSAYARLEDTFGGRLAYSEETSHSGYNAARYHLLRYRSSARPSLFGEVRGPYHRQRAAIQAVLDHEADVAPIDGYAHDLLRRHDPVLAARLRVVETTAPAPSPPLVASSRLDESARERLTAALLEAHAMPDLAPVMEDVLLRRFVRVDERDFALFLDWQRGAESAGYLKIR